MNRLIYLFAMASTCFAFSHENLPHASISEQHGIEALCEQDLHVYSVGISTGGIAEIKMAQLNPNRTIIATTIDEKGAEFAKEQIEAQGLSQQVSVQLEDVSKPLPYKESTFDFIYARLVLHYLSKTELTQALVELHRVLKEGGKLFVVVRSTDCYEASSQDAIYDPITGFTTYTYANGYVASRCFHTEDSIQGYLRNAGFSIESIQSYQEQLCVDFQRTKLSDHFDHLIEIVASK